MSGSGWERDEGLQVHLPAWTTVQLCHLQGWVPVSRRAVGVIRENLVLISQNRRMNLKDHSEQSHKSSLSREIQRKLSEGRGPNRVVIEGF